MYRKTLCIDCYKRQNDVWTKQNDQDWLKRVVFCPQGGVKRTTDSVDKDACKLFPEQLGM